MAVTYIAFIECVLTPKRDWDVVYGFPHMEDPRTDALYKASTEKCEIRLVDIKSDRRYFGFKTGGEVRVVNNVVVFDDDWTEELAIDESKQFPRKTRMDE